MKHRLSVAILAALVLGIAAGFLLHAILSPEARTTWIAGFAVVTDLFLRLIKMIIAPLVLATLAGGIAHMDDPSSLGRIGLRTMIWFLVASIVSLALGWALVSLLRPGAGVHLSHVLGPGGGGVGLAPFSAGSFLEHMVPASVFAALADNEVLQIVVFSLFAGVALIGMGPQAARPLVAGLDALAAMMLRITGYVMWLSPAAVFAALASTVTAEGVGILLVYGRFLGGFYLGLALLWGLLFLAGAMVAGRRIFHLPARLRSPLILAFSTASSEAVLGPTIGVLERFGVRPSVAGFVLPLGYSFNLVGSMMYCSFAAIFLIQAYDVPIDLWGEMAMLAMLMVTSKGIAGVPRAGIVVLAATVPRFGIPEAGLLALLGIDHFLDMGRTATNVIGNAIAAVAVEATEAS